jgi:threonine/homoserine/homoserine lactone efflux protein
MISAFFTCFAITITNPGVVLGFLAIFGSLGKWAPDPGDYTGAAFMVAGVVSGALGWWVLVSATVSHLRGRMTDAWLDWMNRISGLALVAFGLGIFAHLAYAAWS